MPRPKSYDPEEVVVQACKAFWKHGYGALGVRALEQQTGLNKFAIRTEFGGKEGLYRAALDFYHDAVRKTAFVPLRTGGLDQIAAFFEGLVTDGCVNCSAWGCLMVNTGIENAKINSTALRKAADAYWADLGAHFEMALRDQPAGFDKAEAARGLVSAVIGIQTTHRITGTHDAGKPLVQMVLQLLKAWRTGDAKTTAL